MKIPHEVVGRTQPSTQGQAYFADSSGLAAKGLQQLAGAFEGLGGVLQQRQSKVEQFTAIQNGEEFQQNLNLAVTEQRRQADPADTTIAERNLALFNNLAADTLKKTPASQRAAMQSTLEQQKTAFMAGSYKFQYDQQDDWFRKGIGDSLVSAQNAVGKDWSNEGVDAQIAAIQQKIDASDLTVTEKQKITEEAKMLLLSTQYKQAVMNGEEQTASGSATGATVAGGDRGKQLAFVVHELGGAEADANAKLKSATTVEEATAAFIGYERPQGWTPQNPQGGHGFSSRLANAKKVLAGKATAEAMQARGYFESQGYTAEQASGIVGNLMQESGAKLNPGALAKNDAGPGNHSIGIGQWNKERLAAMQKFTGQSAGVDLPDGSGLTSKGSALDADPRFDSIPLDQREAIANDARVLRNRELAAQTAEQKQIHENYTEQMLRDIYTGKVDKNNFTQAWQDGKIDYTEFSKMNEAHNKFTEHNSTLTSALETQGKGMPLDAGGANAIASEFKQPDGLYGKDPAVAQKIISTVRSDGILAPVNQNVLESMIYGSDVAKQAYALKLLAGIADNSVMAWNKLPQELRSRALAFQSQVSTGADDLSAAKKVGGNYSPEEMRQRDLLREQGQKLYTNKELAGVDVSAQPATKLNDLKAYWFQLWSQNPVVTATQVGAINEWYQGAWLANFTDSGNVAHATELTNKQFDDTWKVTNVGTVPTVTRFAPENLMPVSGEDRDHSYMKDQMVAQINGQPGEKYSLVADDTTVAEYQAYQRGGMKPATVLDQIKKGVNTLVGQDILKTDAPPPSYKVLRVSPDGIPRIFLVILGFLV